MIPASDAVEIPPMMPRPRGVWVGVASIVLVAILLRAWAPRSWPVFCDEAVYAQTSTQMATMNWHDALLQPAKAQSLKPPMLFVIRMWLRNLGRNPLVGGR